MSVVALSLLLLAAEPPPSIAVVVTRRTSVTDKDARVLAADAAKLLAASGLELPLSADESRGRLARVGVKDPADCNGRRACIVELGRQLEVAVVVAVSVSAVDADRGVSLDALRVSDQTVLAREQLVLSRTERLRADALTAFAASLRAALAPRPAPEPPPIAELPPDAPTATSVVPAPPAPAPATAVVAAAAPHSRAPAIATLAGAVAAAGAAVALGIVAGNAKRSLTPDAQGHLALTQAEAEAAVQRANVAFPLALGFGAVAAALGVTTAVLW